MWQRTVALCFCLLAGVGAVGWAQDDWLELLKNGSPADIQAAIAAGADVNDYDEHGYTPLIHAASSNPDPEVIRVLLEAGAEINRLSATRNFRASSCAGTSPLYVAVRSSNPEVVRTLVDAGADISHRRCGHTVFMEALARNVSPEVVNLLLEAGADVNQGNYDVRFRTFTSPLLVAVRESTPEVVRILIDAGADVNQRNHRLATALTAAVYRNDLAMVTLLLSAGAKVNVWDGYGNTALRIAEREGSDPAIIQALQEATPHSATLRMTRDEFYEIVATGSAAEVAAALSEGADANTKDEDDYTVLMHALRNDQDLDVIQLLLEAGADVNSIMVLNTGWQALVVAAASNTNPDVIKALVAAGARLDYKACGDQTPLLAAAQSNPNPEIILTLIEAGSSLHDKDADDRTPLMLAARSNRNPEVVHTLIEQGLKIDDRDAHGWTPLMLAAGSNRNPEIIHTLIQAGAAVEDRDAENRSLLMLAVRFDANREVIRTLIELGLDVNDTDSAGRTPLMVAVQSKWNSAIGQLEILLEAGADPSIRDNDGETAWDHLQDNGWLLSRLAEYPHILQTLNP